MNFSSLAILLLSLGCLLSIAPVQGSPCLNNDDAAEEGDAEGDDAEEEAEGEAEGDASDGEEEGKGSPRVIR